MIRDAHWDPAIGGIDSTRRCLRWVPKKSNIAIL
jgi:hypothetical protein